VRQPLKRGFYQRQKHEEARRVNYQFNVDAGQVYANMREVLYKDKENELPKYTPVDNKNAERTMFENIEEASSFWIQLWKSQGTGNRNAQWLENIRSAIYSRVPLPSGKAWQPDTVEATKVLARKRNWSAPGPDRLTNFWWKKAKVLHEGVAKSFQTIANTNIEYPAWFSEGKTTLLPKPGEFTSDNQRLITCLNTLYKWFTLCLLGPANKHLETHGLMDGAQRGARAGCSGTIDNLLFDGTVTLDYHRRKRNLSMAWIDVKKAYDSVDHGGLEEMVILHRFPVWLSRTVEKLSKSWNTRVVANTKQGCETYEPIRFLKGLT